MGKRNEKLAIYYIPKNFLDEGYVFGGKFKTRCFIEACVVSFPVIAGYVYGVTNLGWRIMDTIAYFIVLFGGLFFLFANGWNGDSWLQFFARFKNFRKNKYISKYNPRVKFENDADYLMPSAYVLPGDKLRAFGKSVADKVLGEDGTPISSDITDSRLIVYFSDDEGFVEKPVQLKTKKELREDAKKRKEEEKKRRKEEQEALKKLPKKERKVKAREIKFERKVRKAEELRLINEEKTKNEQRIKEMLEVAEKRKKALYELQKKEQLEQKAAQKAAKREKKLKRQEGDKA